LILLIPFKQLFSSSKQLPLAGGVAQPDPQLPWAGGHVLLSKQLRGPHGIPGLAALHRRSIPIWLRPAGGLGHPTLPKYL